MFYKSVSQEASSREKACLTYRDSLCFRRRYSWCWYWSPVKKKKVYFTLKWTSGTRLETLMPIFSGYSQHSLRRAKWQRAYVLKVFLTKPNKIIVTRKRSRMDNSDGKCRACEATCNMSDCQCSPVRIFTQGCWGLRTNRTPKTHSFETAQNTTCRSKWVHLS